MAEWPLVKWTVYGRWSEDGRRVYASVEHVAGTAFETVIYDVREERTLADAMERAR